MSIPGMPPFGAAGAGGNSQMQGLSEQEQNMVKMVSTLFSIFLRARNVSSGSTRAN
jgi:hypothetical protein